MPQRIGQAHTASGMTRLSQLSNNKPVKQSKVRYSFERQHGKLEKLTDRLSGLLERTRSAFASSTVKTRVGRGDALLIRDINEEVPKGIEKRPGSASAALPASQPSTSLSQPMQACLEAYKKAATPRERINAVCTAVRQAARENIQSEEKKTGETVTSKEAKISRLEVTARKLMSNTEVYYTAMDDFENLLKEDKLPAEISNLLKAIKPQTYGQPVR